jgi:hypothetical protein
MKNTRLIAFVSIVALTVAGSLFAATKKSVNVNLLSDMSLNGKELSAGHYKITWDEGSPETAVTVAKDGKVVAEGKGKLVERDTPALDDAVVSHKSANGSPTLSEIRFRGKKAVLVLSES